MNNLFNVIFTGNLQPDTSLPETIEKVAALFKISPQKTEAFINGKTEKIIKKNVPLAVAEKYRERLVKAGLEIVIAKSEDNLNTNNNIKRFTSKEKYFNNSTKINKYKPSTSKNFSKKLSGLISIIFFSFFVSCFLIFVSDGKDLPDKRLNELQTISPEKLSIDDRLELFSKLSIRLFSLVKKDDFGTFKSEMLLSRSEFINYLRQPKASAQDIDSLYSRYLEQFQKSWEHLQKEAEKQNIQWQNAEYLGSGGSSNRTSGHYGLSFRANRKNYSFKFALSGQTGKWRFFQLKGTLEHQKKRAKPTIETSRKKAGVNPIQETYSFNIDPPETGYTVVYFNTKTMEVLSQEHLDYFAITDNRKRMDPHARSADSLFNKGVKFRDVAIYAIRKVEAEKDLTKWLYVDILPLMEIQIDIDGIIVKSKYLSYNTFDFTKGRHKLEILLKPKGDTRPVSFDLKNKVQDYSRRELKASLDASGIKDFDLWMASFYAPEKSAEAVEIELEESRRPVVLLLSNYETAFVKIKNTKGANLKAVVLRDLLTDVRFDSNNEIPIYGMLEPHSFMYIKSLFEDDPGSGNSSIARKFLFDNVALTFPEKYISGFSYQHKANVLRVPETHIKKKDYFRARKKLENADIL